MVDMVNCKTLFFFFFLELTTFSAARGRALMFVSIYLVFGLGR